MAAPMADAANLRLLLDATLETARLMSRAAGGDASFEQEHPRRWRHVMQTAAESVAVHWKATGEIEPPPGIGELAVEVARSTAAREHERFADEFDFDQDPELEASILDDAIGRAAILSCAQKVSGESLLFAFWRDPDAYARESRQALLMMAILMTRELAEPTTPAAALMVLFRTTLDSVTSLWIATHRARRAAIREELRDLPDEEKRRMQREFRSGSRDLEVLDEVRRRAAEVAGEIAKVNIDELLPLLGARPIA